MALVTCPDCGHAVSDAASACIHCGRPLDQPAEARKERAHAELAATPGQVPPQTSSGEPASAPSAPSTHYPLFPVATHKFVVLSLCTFSLYELYWCFKNWQRIKEPSGEQLSPFWRAFFAPLWGFSLFRRIHQYADARHLSAHWSPGILGTFYLVLSATWRLPDPWWLISLASFVPFISVVQTAGEINARAAAAEDRNDSYSGANIATVIVGGLLLILAIIGTFAPA